MSTELRKAVFLDRDGTINIEKQYLYRIEDFEYLDGVINGLKTLSDMGYTLVVVTNQSGIARGFYTEQDYKKLDTWMRMDLLKKGIRIEASYYCPHLPGGPVVNYALKCECRKPKTGMYWKAAQELNIDMEKSFAVGDKRRDLEICRESGVRGILLSDRKETDDYFDTCRNWAEIVQTILSYEGS